MINIFKKLLSKRKFSDVDFAILKTSMMLASLDGAVSADEVANFRELASSCPGFTPESFSKLWDETLRSAGYMLLQSRLLSKEDLVALFVREVRPFFTQEVSMEVSADRDRAFDLLTEMARADGDFSDIEREAIAALAKSVAVRREELIGAMCPQCAK